MSKTILSLAVSGLLLALGLPAEAQQAKKVPRIGYVMGRSGPMEFDEAFQREMRELSYVEGQNIIIEYGWGDGREERVRDLIDEVVRVRPEILVTSTTHGVLV